MKYMQLIFSKYNMVSSKNPRDQQTYEKDTVRVNLINNENLNYYLSLFKINE